MTTALNPAWTAGITGGKGVAAVTGAPYIAGITTASGNPGYFHDQYSNPIALFSDTPWSIIYQSGADTTYTWQQEMDYFTATRAGQGYNAFECNLLPNTSEGTYAGKTWDGVFPFLGTGGSNPANGLNGTYWQRLDYLLASAAAKGMTGILNLCMADDLAGLPGSGWTDTQWQQYGNAVAARYAPGGTSPAQNFIWMIGDDYFGYNDAEFSAILTGVRAAGDTRPIAIENITESTSRRDFGSGTAGTAMNWGLANAVYQWIYSYNCSYLGVEYAYGESSPILVLRGDGWYYDWSSEELARTQTWWALSSGSRGWSGGVGAGDYGKFAAGWRSDVTSGAYQSATIGHIITAFSGLPGWHRLIPDTGNVFITAGRGTKATPYTSGQGSSPSYSGTADTYVTGSITPAGDLAVIYFSHSAAASTITIDQTKMTTGYSAHWVDPASGATSAGTPGTTYNPSGTKGSNSAGNPDWVLVLSYP